MTGQGAWIGPLIGVAFVLGGGGLVTYGVHQLVARARHTRMRETRGTMTTGVVVDVVWKGTSSNSRGHPRVSFADHRGTERTFTGATGSDGPPLPGKRLKVWYDPLDDTVEPVVTNDWRAVFFPLLAIAVGGFFLLLVCFGVYSVLTSPF